MRIARLAAGGDGVARLSDGRAVFVPDTAPGDLVRIRVETMRRRFARGRVIELLEAGESRREAPCPHASECGGCAWQHLEYAAQLRAKEGIVRDALERIGGWDAELPIPVVPSPHEFGYRSRARLRRGGEGIGYLRRESHSLHPIDHCPVLLPEMNDALQLIGALPRDDEQAQAQEVHDVFALCAGETGRVQIVREGGAPSGEPDPAEEDRARPVLLRADEDALRISPGSFTQGNALLRDALLRAVHDSVGRGEDLLELYAGVGFFTLGLARRFVGVTAVESAPPAVADLRFNLRHAGLRNVEVIEEAAEHVCARLEPGRFEVVLLDPPRVGLGEAGARVLAGLGAQRIVYLSCDPATLARDLAILFDAGYVAGRVTAFDLFPQTPHVETLVELVLG